MADAVAILMNEAMIIERSKHLGAAPYERTEERVGYANGYKEKSLNTRVGPVKLKVPQTRHCDFYPQSLERGLSSERALLASLAEMYVQGVSTRRVKKIVEELCGMEVSSTQVSRATQKLDDELKAWRERKLGAYAYLILDTQYQKVRQGGQVRDAAVLIAIGVCPKGHRDVLGASVSLSEAKVHWRTFLASLKDRGLHGMQLVVSDAHEGLAAARRAVFPSVPWQRCQFHLQQNAGQYVTTQAKRGQIAGEIRSIFNAPDRAESERLLAPFVERHQGDMPKLADWAESAIPHGLTVFALPSAHQRRMRTTNVVERHNEEIKRRTKVARLFPDEDSCLRLVSAILMEIAEDWQTADTRYVTFSN